MTRQATRFVANQQLGATQLNRVVDLANDLAKEVAGVRGVSTGSQTLFLLEIKALQASALTCVFPGESANPSAFEWTIRLPLMLYEASRPFGGTIGTVTYSYTSINERNATNGTDNETQFLTPPFVVGESIQVSATLDGSEYVFVADGRMWAVDPPP